MTDRRTPGNEEVIEAIDSVIAEHVATEHVFEVEHLNVLVTEHRELYDQVAPIVRDTNTKMGSIERKVDLLIAEMYGAPHPTAADPDHRTGGMVSLLTEMRDSMKAMQGQAGNGGIPVTRKWTGGQWAFYGALASGWFVLVAAVVAAVWPG